MTDDKLTKDIRRSLKFIRQTLEHSKTQNSIDAKYVPFSIFTNTVDFSHLNGTDQIPKGQITFAEFCFFYFSKKHKRTSKETNKSIN